MCRLRCVVYTALGMGTELEVRQQQATTDGSGTTTVGNDKSRGAGDPLKRSSAGHWGRNHERQTRLAFFLWALDLPLLGSTWIIDDDLFSFFSFQEQGLESILAAVFGMPGSWHMQAHNSGYTGAAGVFD